MGDGALMAALTAARGRQMRDIVATIQREQDEIIRAPSPGVTLISGGPGTGKTVVALHRAAYLLYTERRRIAGGGVLVVGPSPVFMSYIERVLPSLGEHEATLRSIGEVVDGAVAVRSDAVRGRGPSRAPSRIRRVLGRASRARRRERRRSFACTPAGGSSTLGARELAEVRAQVLRRGARRNRARADAVRVAPRRLVAPGSTGRRVDVDRPSPGAVGRAPTSTTTSPNATRSPTSSTPGGRL